MYIVYVNDKNGNPITQIFTARDFSGTSKLSDFGTAEFSLDPSDKENNFTTLREFNEVIITYKDWDTDEVEKFRGYLKTRRNTSKGTLVHCRTYEHLLERKKTNVDGNVTNQLKIIIQSLLDQVNGRYNSGITLDCNVTDTYNLKYTKWESILSILKRITSTYEFTMIGKVLVIAPSVWVDRSTWWDIVEYIRDINAPWYRTILDYEISRDADNIANAIQSKETFFVSNSDSINVYGRIEETITIWDGVDTDSQLVKRSEWLTKVSVTPTIWVYDNIWLWDIVKVKIDNGTEISRVTWVLKVYEKSRNSGSYEVSNIKLSSTKPFTLDILDVIRENLRRVERIELKT